MPLSMHFPSPDVVKIDVEGAEYEVLRAATRILRVVRPSIYCELSDKQRGAVVELLKSHHFALGDGESFKGLSQPMAGCTSHNIVGISEEKVCRQ